MSHPAHDEFPADLPPTRRLPLPPWYLELFESGKHRPPSPRPPIRRALPPMLPVESLIPIAPPPAGAKLTIPSVRPRAPEREPRGVYRCKTAPVGYRGYYAVDRDGLLVLRLDIREGRNTRPREVKAWLIAALNWLDPDGAGPELELIP